MERAEYERMHEVEDRMWWYRGLRALAAQLLVRALPGSRGDGPVLDAGCGTGGMLRELGDRVPGRPTFGLEYDSVAAALAAGVTQKWWVSLFGRQPPPSTTLVASWGFLALVLPIVWKLQQRASFAPRYVPAFSALIALAGGCWLAQRLLPLLLH